MDDVYTLRQNGFWFAYIGDDEADNGSCIAGPCRSEEAVLHQAREWFAAIVCDTDPH